MSNEQSRPVPVAIIGMGCMFPQASDLGSYWANILNRVDAITGVPPTHWRPEDYLDPDPKAPDRTYAARGGFLSPVDFPALEFGITPNTLEATDTTQLLGLMVARQALANAGYGPERDFDRNRVSVILGVTGTLELVIPLGARLGHPIWKRALQDAGVPDDMAQDVLTRIADSYVGWQEDSFPGLLGNVVAGRIANRLDLGGTNCVVDAACASSLSALHLAMLELAAGRCDMAVSGGMDTFNDIFMYMCFSKTPALSPTGNARPFDRSGDGTILGEGLGCLILKRLSDAERDGDRIYAVIRALGSSSDGKGHAIYAPSSAGQTRALRNAYRLAGISPDTIELVEAHGTGTRAGDAAEAAALTEVYRSDGVEEGKRREHETWCALGSIKSQIGHTKAAAGAAGLIKTVLALHHKVLPPTIKVEQPIEALEPGTGPFYVNIEKRPWLPPNHPRRAAVSAFGFGGSNFHCVLEEYRPEKTAVDWDGNVQIAAFSADTPEQLLAALTAWPASDSWEAVRLESVRTRDAFSIEHAYRLTLVIERGTTNINRLRTSARTMLEKHPSQRTWSTPDGVYFGSGPRDGMLGMVFPGQGSQYVGMGRDLACRFPEFLQALTEADHAFASDSAAPCRRLSDFIYPQPVFDDAAKKCLEAELRATDIAQPALGAMGLGALRVLAHFGVQPDAVAGHSYGELVALHAAGRFDADTLHALSRLRGRLMAQGSSDRGAMLAVSASLETLQAILQEEALELVIANKNAPQQLVLSGATKEIARANEVLTRRRIQCKALPVSAAFHSPLVAEARVPFYQALTQIALSPGQIPVFANSTAREYPDDPEEARRLLSGQLAEPVEFVATIEQMYRAGVRTFLEAGPGNKLIGLVGAILEGREHTVLAVDASTGKRSGSADLARVVAQLSSLGYPVDLDRWDEVGDRLQPPEAKKPGLTVRICGANYVKPKEPKAPTARAIPEPASLVQAVHPARAADCATNGESNGQVDKNGTHPPNERRARSLNSENVSRLTPEKTMPKDPSAFQPSMPPVDGAVLSQSLRMTQDNLLALQKLGEQTAQLHRQFLEGQDKTLQLFQSLLEQQRHLVMGSLGNSAPSPSSAWSTSPHPSTPATPVEVRSPAPTTQAPRSVEAPPVQSRSLPVPAPVLEKITPVAANGHTKTILLDVVSEKTGYPAETLELDMELDADLGIDSIKRVEIFSRLQERLPQAPVIKPENLGNLRTLRQVVAFLNETETSPPLHENRVAAPLLPNGKPAGDPKVLLEVVAEKTGYPAEMLELDMELDADLGIDSIKRVEIFSRLQERLPQAPVIKPEHLGNLRTLRHVLEFMAGSDSTEAETSHLDTTPLALNGHAGPSTEDRLRRFILSLHELDQSTARRILSLAAGGEIWITDDGTSLAGGVFGRLNVLGHRPRLIGWNEAGSLARPNRLAGLVILTPPGPLTDGFLVDAFKLLQLAGPGLRAGGKAGGSVFVTVSRLDGSFGLASFSTDMDPLSGGLAGLAKTAGHEWADVHCKALDLAAAWDDPDEAALAIVEEMQCDGPVEVGLTPGARHGLALSEMPLDRSSDITPLTPGDVVVVTGGGRGVTAEVAVALAREFAPTIVLLGRSAEPSSEPAWLSPLADEGAIKRAIKEHVPGTTTPKEIGEHFARMTANREMLRTLERIRATGAQVHYRQVDIRNEEAVREVIVDIRAAVGPVKGLIHGAGVLADRLIVDKNEEQFTSVYSTKVAGLRNLLAACAGDELRVLVLFSSSTGRFGRAGQVDYAVANEILNKMAQREARQRPACRVVSVNWGPWDGGMVTPALKKVFAQEGVSLIPLGVGAEYLVQEIRQATGPVEVVVLGPGSRIPTAPETAPAVPVSSALPATALVPAFELPVNVEGYPILTSHVIDGRAVVPMALTLEWLAHGALHGNPGLLFHGFNDLRICKAIQIEEERPRNLRVLTGKASKRDSLFVVPVEMHGTGGEGRDVLHARAEIVLTARLPRGQSQARDLPCSVFPHDLAEAYNALLFHGPMLHGIERIESCSPQGISATVAAAPSPASWIQHPLRTAWLADPLVLDCSFQLMTLWSFETLQTGCLPCFAAQYRQFRRSFPREGTRVVAVVTRQSAHQALADIEYRDHAGEVIATLSGYECVIDASLNHAFRRNRLTREFQPAT